MNYFWVRALTSGPWRGVDVLDVNNMKIGERTLVMATDHGPWCIDNRSVTVEPGLVVSFRDHGDAMWFAEQDRARGIAVEPGNILPFESEADADFFVRKGLAEYLSRSEVAEYIDFIQQQQRKQIEGGEDDMAMSKAPENKSMPKPQSTKSAAKPAKAAPAKGKGGKK